MVAAQVLALIPARGGSKSLPRKNIRPLRGVPLIAYSIEAARQSRRNPRVLVSTDDEEIARIAASFGAEVPFLRPAELAQDDTLDLPVFLHALDWLEAQEGYHPEFVLQLRPTSPLRPPGLVDQALDLLEARPEADSARAVVPAGQNPYKMWRLTEAGTLVPLFDSGIAEAYNQPRQRLPRAFWQTGHLDAARTATLRGLHSMTGSVILPIPVDARYAIDLDTPEDWDRLEALFHAGFHLPIVLPAANRRESRR